MVWERVAAMVVWLDGTDDRGDVRVLELSVGGGQVFNWPAVRGFL